ncbi:MAG TPA: hypothetical protein GX695_04345 [Acholeplasmataceae bacterium]|nr:hypothetical protein [Acholeplasmataceae bacterium]
MIQVLIITLFAATIIVGIGAINYSLKVKNDNMKYSKIEEINPAAINLR